MRPNRLIRPGTLYSKPTRRRVTDRKTALACLLGVAFSFCLTAQSFGVTVFLKSGYSYYDVEIVRQTRYSITVRTPEGHIKFIRQRDVIEIAETAPKRPIAAAPKPIVETASGNLYAFKNADGKVVLTDKPQQYDPDIYEPMYVPLGKAEFYRPRRRSNSFVRLPSLVPSPPSSRIDSTNGLNELNDIIDFHAKRKGLSQALVKAVIRAESSGNPRARSRCGACGLMQLMPATAAEMDIYDLFDPDQNIAGGTQYLAKMFELFQGDKRLALAAYNAGPGAVKKYSGIPPYPETRNYVDRVLRFEREYDAGTRFMLASAVSTPSLGASPLPAEPQEFTITLVSGYTIRGSSYRRTSNGFDLLTTRGWQLVPTNLISETNFT